MSNAVTLARTLSNVAPVFSAQAHQITCLTTPTAFYESIIRGIEKAQRRILLATLYLGTDHMERRLVESLRCRLEGSESTTIPKIHLHLDRLRGSRGYPGPSSIALLRPLLQYPAFSLSLYMTPAYQTNNWLHSWIPHRWNETLGLSHIKFCVFDDDVLLMGANLSQSYFTNRTDRYLLIHNHPQLADYFTALMGVLQRISYKLKEDSTETDPDTPHFTGPELTDRVATIEIESFLERFRRTHPQFDGTNDTFLLPTLQMAPHSILHDERFLKQLLILLNNHENVKHLECSMATGYFNFPPVLKRIFQQTPLLSSRTWRVLAPSPACNGFYRAAGWSRHIPGAYRSLEYAFLKKRPPHYRPHLTMDPTGQECLWEWFRPGFVYHAKGLWFDFADNVPGPFITVIGSTNFGYRSFKRDLEAQLTIITDSPLVKSQLRAERDQLFEDSSMVSLTDLDRDRPSLPVRMATRLLRPFL